MKLFFIAFILTNIKYIITDLGQTNDEDFECEIVNLFMISPQILA